MNPPSEHFPILQATWLLSGGNFCGEKKNAGEAFISTRSKACVISTDYMQICHRHKCPAVHSLTFLFVTSKPTVGPRGHSTSLISVHLFPTSLHIKYHNVFGCLSTSPSALAFYHYWDECFSKQFEPWFIAFYALLFLLGDGMTRIWFYLLIRWPLALHQHSRFSGGKQWADILSPPISSPLSHSSWDSWPSGWHHFYPRTPTVQLFAISHPDG